jgi:hypothetical protein
MGLALFDFITIFFAGGLATFLVTTGVTGRMFVDETPAAGAGGESAANTTVATAKETRAVTMVVEIAFIIFPFLSLLLR